MGYKSNIQKSNVLLYTGNEIKTIIPFIMLSKRMSI